MPYARVSPRIADPKVIAVAAQGIPRKAPGPAAVPRRGSADRRGARAGERLPAGRDRAAQRAPGAGGGGDDAGHQGDAAGVPAERQGLRHRRHHRGCPAGRLRADRGADPGHRQPRAGRRRFAGDQAGELRASTTRSRKAPATSTSSRATTCCACATASTAACTEKLRPPLPDARRRRQPNQDHGRPGHLRTPPAAGRRHPRDDGQAADRPARQHHARQVRRKGRHPRHRQRQGVGQPREARLRLRHAQAVAASSSACPTASCSSPAPPAAARAPRSTPSCRN